MALAPAKGGSLLQYPTRIGSIFKGTTSGTADQTGSKDTSLQVDPTKVQGSKVSLSWSRCNLFRTTRVPIAATQMLE